MNQETVEYKMVFCDIDGTLLNSQNQISKGTREKIQALDRAQIPFVLVSARMPSGIFPLQRELEISAPLVCYSGALILDETGQEIRSVGIDRERAIHMAHFVRKDWRGISCSAFSGHRWLVEDLQDKWILQEQNITSSIAVKARLSHSLLPEEPVHKLLCMGETEDITELETALRKKPHSLSIHRSKDTYLEMMDGAASKAGAVRYLCETLGIPIEETVSFGDHFNDVDMLQATGLCFAMGNAPEEVKRLAGNVTLDNDQEGVLVALQQLRFANIDF